MKNNCLVEINTVNCSICNLEIMAIAETDRDKALNVRIKNQLLNAPTTDPVTSYFVVILFYLL